MELRQSLTDSRAEEAAVFAEWRVFAERIATLSWGGFGLTVDDRISLAHEALLRAIRTFDDSKGASFKSWVRANVKRFLRDGVTSWLSHRQATRTGLSREALEALWSSWCGPYASEDAERGRLEAVDAVRVALGALDERSRTMLVAMYFRDADSQDAAALIGLSKSWGSRLHKQALAKCREILTG